MMNQRKIIDCFTYLILNILLILYCGYLSWENAIIYLITSRPEKCQ